MRLEPYHEQGGVVLYHGDSRELLGELDLTPATTVVITDPVWPNCPAHLLEEWACPDPDALWAAVCPDLSRLARRIVVILGCRSDVRFLRHVPSSHGFVRSCLLRYDVPSYQGVVLNCGEHAYVFGSLERPHGLRNGKPRRVIAGEHTASTPMTSWRFKVGHTGHPTKRSESHIAWLIDQLTQPGDVMLGPFAGGGTTLRRALDMGRRAVGIEMREDYCAEAVDRLRQQPLLVPREEQPRAEQLGLEEGR